MQRSWRLFFTRISSLDGIKVEIFRRYKIIKIINSRPTVLNKLQSYSRISALGPEGHCASRFKRAMCISCQQYVDVHKGEREAGSCGRMWRGGGGRVKHPILCMDVINGWPLTLLSSATQLPPSLNTTFTAFMHYPADQPFQQNHQSS